MPYAPYTPYASYTSNTQCTLFMQKNDNTSYIILRDLPVLWEMVSVPDSAVSRAVRQEEARFSG